jgi:hypothetical protein
MSMPPSHAATIRHVMFYMDDGTTENKICQIKLDFHCDLFWTLLKNADIELPLNAGISNKQIRQEEFLDGGFGCCHSP